MRSPTKKAGRSTMIRNPPLRRLAIHVEEPRCGALQWILSEVDETAALIEVERVSSREALPPSDG